MNRHTFQRKRDGMWFACVVFTDPTTGKKIDRIRAARDEHHARTVLAALVAEITGQAPEPPTVHENGNAVVTTFKYLAQSYSAHEEDGSITLRAMTTKTLNTRVVPLSDRLWLALFQLAHGTELVKGSLPKTDERIFPFIKIQNGWTSACRDAGITDLHFHVLRATFATRLIHRNTG